MISAKALVIWSLPKRYLLMLGCLMAPSGAGALALVMWSCAQEITPRIQWQRCSRSLCNIDTAPRSFFSLADPGCQLNGTHSPPMCQVQMKPTATLRFFSSLKSFTPSLIDLHQTLSLFLQWVSPKMGLSHRPQRWSPIRVKHVGIVGSWSGIEQCALACAVFISLAIKHFEDVKNKKMPKMFCGWL